MLSASTFIFSSTEPQITKRWPRRESRRSIFIKILALAWTTVGKASNYYDDIYYNEQYVDDYAGNGDDNLYSGNDDYYSTSSTSTSGSSSAKTIVSTSSQFDHGLALSVCENSVVAVTYMSVLCDSPYTFYYGNGANRNSYVCDYGDKATLSVQLQVVDDLQQEDGEIFFTMAAFDDANNLLMSTYPEQMCQNYLNGMDCTKAGTYNFEKKLKFGTPYSGNANRTKFYPVIHMAFSTKSDSGYNLGAVNMECQQWDQDQPSFVAWSDESPRTSGQEFAIDYGLLIVTGVMLTVFGLYIWARSYDNPVFGGDFLPNEDSRETSFMDL